MGERLDQLLDIGQASRFRGLQPSTLRRLCATRQIPFVRITNRRAVRFSLFALEEMVRSRTQVPIEK